MTPKAQRYLARLLADMRRSGTAEAPRDVRNTALAHFGTGVRALRAAGVISDDEHSDWMARAREATGWDTPRGIPVASAGSSAFPPPVADPDLPRFARLVPAPNREYDFFGGRLRILGVELYDTEMAVQWRMAPLPDMDAALPENAVAAERDTEGMPEEGRAAARRERHRHHWDLLRRFVVTDDAGGTYSGRGGGAVGGGSELMGRLVVNPGIHDGAATLIIDALGVIIRIPLL